MPSMLCCLLFLGSSTLYLTNAEERRFVQWMRTTNNLYSGDEYHFRLGIFLSNSRFIESHNKNPRKTFRVSLNKFAALTPSEIATMLHNQRTHYRNLPNVNSSDNIRFNKDNKKLPESVDWREKGAVTEIKNQGMCGSCWAFSTIVAQEGCHQIETGELLRLSEQNLVDCADNCHGCDGGWPIEAFNYVLNKQGGKYCTDDDYPYTAEQALLCYFYRVQQPVSNIASVYQIPQGDEEAMKEVVANWGPVAINVDSNYGSFNFYDGGIYVEESCQVKYVYSHAMGIIGYGSAEGQDFWIVKNSWGPDWGEEGYIRWQRGTDMCNIADFASIPRYH